MSKVKPREILPKQPCGEHEALTRPLTTGSIPVRNPYANLSLPTAPLPTTPYLGSGMDVNETVNEFNSGDIHGVQYPVDDSNAHKESASDSEQSISSLADLSADDHVLRHPIPTSSRPPHESDDLARWLSGPTDDIAPLTHVVPRRERKQELLPYTMVPINEEDRQCELCGPPFKEIPWNKFQDLSICTWECGKRYFVEKLSKPVGCHLIHGKSIPNHVFGRCTALHTDHAADLIRDPLSEADVGMFVKSTRY